MRFSSVSHAVGFAEEILNRPAIKNTYAVLMGSYGRGQDINEVRDLAMTISVELANLDDKAASAVFRYIYGKGDHTQLMNATMTVSRFIIEAGLHVGDVEIEVPDYQIRSMVLAVLKQEREVERGAKRTYAKLGRMLGFNDGRKFRVRYRDAVALIRAEIFRLIDKADKAMTMKLNELDLFE